MTETSTGLQLLAQLFGEQPQPVFWMKPLWGPNETGIIDFEYFYCNAAMYQFSGLSPVQLIGNRISNTLTLKEENKAEVIEQMALVLTSGKKFEGSIYNTQLNKYYSFTRTRVEGGVLTVIQDRTEEYKMIRELETQKNLLNSILTYSPSGISVSKMIRDSSGNVADAITLLANEAAIQATGLSKEDYLGKTAKETDPSVFESPLYRMVLETLRTGLPFQTQYHIQPTDRWLELSVSKIDEDHMVNVFTDVTATKKAQLDLEKAVTQLSLVFNTAQAGLFTLRPVENEAGHIIDFRFGLVNQSVASYIGEKAETLGGALASIYFPAYRENGLFDIYKDTMLSGNPHQFDFHYEDGYDVFFNIHTVKSGDEVLVTFTDHTVLKRLQRELETTIEELKRSNANLEEFAYAASHDLKEPIRKIHFFSDRLKERLKSRLDEEEQRLFGRMQTATERMRSLVDDLLLYSQVGVRPRSFEEVDLSYLIELIAGDLELEIEEKKAVLKWEGLPTVNGHMRQLQQLFHNLLGNALKYTRPGIAPEIFLSCSLITGRESGIHLPADELGRHFYQIKVKDNGIGFEQKDAEKIFHVFQRLHGNSEYRGTGVGLSIARKVAENHHGYISAQSEPGKGSIFQVLLPRQV